MGELARVELTDEQRGAFIEYVREHRECSIREAAEAVGVRRADVKALKKSSPEFEEDYRDARGYSNEQIVNAMVKQAIDGIEEPIVSAGKVVTDEKGRPLVKRVYSDRLLQVMFSSMTPEGKAMVANKLGIEISGPDGGPIELQRGIGWDEVAKVLAAAGKEIPAIDEAPEGTAEIVGVEDD